MGLITRRSLVQIQPPPLRDRRVDDGSPAFAGPLSLLACGARQAGGVSRRSFRAVTRWRAVCTPTQCTPAQRGCHPVHRGAVGDRSVAYGSIGVRQEIAKVLVGRLPDGCRLPLVSLAAPPGWLQGELAIGGDHFITQHEATRLAGVS